MMKRGAQYQQSIVAPAPWFAEVDRFENGRNLAGIPLFAYAWPPRFDGKPTDWSVDNSSALEIDDTLVKTPYAGKFMAGDTISVVRTGERMKVVHVDSTTFSIVRNV